MKRTLIDSGTLGNGPFVGSFVRTMRNIKLTIRYDGTGYSGWQVQKNSKTIQETIENALRKITGRKASLIASGRTDAGVHALAQVANFRTTSKIPLKNLQMALNSNLPKDIAIFDAEEVGHDFNSQKDAVSKLYRYTIYNKDFMDPLLRRYAAKCFFRLDDALMRKAAKHLTGRHDFRSFQAKDGSSRPCAQGRDEEKNSVRAIKNIKIRRDGDVLYIDVEADGFLYNMARNIVGTLIEVARGKFSVDQVKEIMRKKDRRLSGPTAPAKGLCLVKVRY